MYRGASTGHPGAESQAPASATDPMTITVPICTTNPVILRSDNGIPAVNLPAEVSQRLTVPT